MKMVDFQFLTEGDPLLDLGVALFYNCSNNFSLDSKELVSLLELYHTTLANRMRELNTETPFTDFQDLKLRFWKTFNTLTRLFICA